MHVIVQCSNCGVNVRPELGVATATTVQHRECAERFGLGTRGKPTVVRLDDAIRHRPRADAALRASSY